MIDQLAPDTVVVAVAREDSATTLLYPGEAAAVARASPARRHEFAQDRACARRALYALGVVDVSVLVGLDREPCWPTGIVGSITHTAGYCAASAARATDILALGIDAELRTPTDLAFERFVCTTRERAFCRFRGDAVPWPNLLFSAKESVYKAWFPLAGQWIEFQDIELSVDPENFSFQAVVAARDAPVFEGRLAFTERHVFSVAMASAPSARQSRGAQDEGRPLARVTTERGRRA